MSARAPQEKYQKRGYKPTEEIVDIMTDELIQQSCEKGTTAKKVRRAFSIPRNPFRWSRKFKTNKGDCASDGKHSEKCNQAASDAQGGTHSNDVEPGNRRLHHHQQQQQQQQPPPQQQQHLLQKLTPHREGNSQSSSSRVFRRSSFRRLLSRIAQHVSFVSIGANKHSVAQNVPDRVPPIGGYQWPPDQTPGVTGLKNHGNTCFMNAVLQCLSHTDILAEYFVLDQYKADLKRRNKLNSRKFGTKGELTEQLANVLKALWTCKNESDHSTSFKAVVDRYGSQFRSSTQHDAQEFLFWLLDKVHEDLNTATKRRYKTIKNNYGRPDEVIAAETLANHIRCNNSFVQAVFQAQFRSSLTCPRCKKQSNTFDPFHCISVQLPQLSQQVIFVTVLYVTQHPRQVKLGLTVPPGSPIMALRKQLHADTGIAINRMVLADINESGFSRVFYDSQSIATLDELDSVYCIEVPEIKEENSSDLMILIANVKKNSDGTVCRFGTPFCVQVNRDCSYVELQKKLLKEMSSTLKPEVFAYSTPLTEMFQIRVQDPSADPDTYLEEVEHPLFMEVVDMALSVLSPDAGPPHIKLLLEWTNPEDFFVDLSDPIVEHESVSLLRDSKSEQAVLTLEQCLEHYTKAETLSAEDAWRCPNCQQYLPVVKTLGLWSLPDILVVHFKRFRQQHDKGPDAAKLTTMVKFPLNSFDMSPHLARGSSSSDCLNEEHPRNVGSPWRKSRDHKLKEKDNKDNRYDLYAVCYHQGDTLETGHYTAACKNPYDHQWYKFDDQRVTHVPADEVQEQIVNNEAYILFYQRRSIDITECSGTSSTSGDHWVSRIAVPIVPTQSSCTNVALNADISSVAEKQEHSVKEEEIKILTEGTEGGSKAGININLQETVVIEKTDENELVDIETLEFMDGNSFPNGTKEEIEENSPTEDVVVISNGEIKKEIFTKIVSPEKPFKKEGVTPERLTNVSALEKALNLQKNSPARCEITGNPQQLLTNGITFKGTLSGGMLNGREIGEQCGGQYKHYPLTKSSSYRLKECDNLSMRRNAVNSCSKDTLIFIDQQSHSLIDEDDSYLGSRSLWISPVAPHKLITVSPKN